MTSVAKSTQDGGSFSNIYFKILNGKIYDPMSKGHQKLFVGDINGDPINGTAWRLHCHKAQYIYSGQKLLAKNYCFLFLTLIGMREGTFHFPAIFESDSGS